MFVKGFRKDRCELLNMNEFFVWGLRHLFEYYIVWYVWRYIWMYLIFWRFNFFSICVRFQLIGGCFSRYIGCFLFFAPNFSAAKLMFTRQHSWCWRLTLHARHYSPRGCSLLFLTFHSGAVVVKCARNSQLSLAVLRDLCQK